MSLLYKNKEDQKMSVDVSNSDGKINFLFHNDGGKHGAIEILDGYSLTPERLLQILQDREDYTEDEI